MFEQRESMNGYRNLALPLGVCLLTTLIASPLFAWPDTVQSDRTYTGTITAMTPDTITIETAGGAQVIAAETVKRVTLDLDPSELKTARNSALSGQYNRVPEELDKISPLPSNDFVRTEILFYRAKAIALMAISGEEGTLSDAVKAVGDFVRDKAAESSYHFYEASELYGDLAMAMGRPDGAQTYYGKLLESKSNLTLLRANTKMGDALNADGKFKEAIAAYDKAMNIEVNDPTANDLKRLAGVGRASALAETGKPDEGIAYLDELIKNEDSTKTELFGRAYNALGKCYMKQGKTKEAVHAYLFTDLLFFANAANHAEALYYLSQLWTTLNRPERAREAKQKLSERYQNTPWAKK
jgi:tetratricopeptide (TPR) repeat protein